MYVAILTAEKMVLAIREFSIVEAQPSRVMTMQESVPHPMTLAMQ